MELFLRRLSIRRHLNGVVALPRLVTCCYLNRTNPEVSTVDEWLWALLIFALGGLVTAATVAMIVREHLYWRNRGSTDVR